jgi:hypothetical protein
MRFPRGQPRATGAGGISAVTALIMDIGGSLLGPEARCLSWVGAFVGRCEDGRVR